MRSSADIQQPIVDLDRCWGVPVAAACIVFLSCIASANYGFLYVLFMQRHGLSREQVAWPQTLLLISGGCVGLLVSVVQKKFSIYHITLAGGILTSAGLVGASFAPSIVWFSVAYGVVQVLLQVFSEYGNSLFMTTIVDYATDKGAELGRAKTAIMFAAIGKAVGRVLVPVVSDKTSFSRSSITMACLYVTALCFYIITRISAFEAVAALATVAGVTQGYTICMRPLLVADHLGVERLSLCSGVAGLAGMPMCLSGPAILGYFRDKHGSYDTLYYMLSGLNLVVAVLLTVLVACPVTKQRHCFTKQASLKTSFNEERV
ncbi:uncharacterized protein LOC119159376 isoform X2 [Rhipicephalus microplus]|uniref:uncharacterized protein LOC119159376 isoform X2 n=1 Tax=Rhipicephalus microplus TaxID=6941 RepID=UPI003F6C3D73